MDSSDQDSSEVLARGARSSIVEKFGIRGLYGYRSIALESDYAATILIAKNGTGKTTLLGALDAFLRLQFSRLRNLEFSEIHCKLRSIDEELILTHEDVIEFLQVPTEGELVKAASRASIEPSTLFKFILDEAYTETPETDSETRIYHALLSSTNYNGSEVRELCSRLRKALFDRQPKLSLITSSVERALHGYEIVYLPTYRRIELALTDEDRQLPHKRKRRPKFNVAAGSLFTGDIQFGLSDISDRLSHLNQRIIVESNNGYRKISANIIDELINGTFDEANDAQIEIPNETDLKIFFSRLEQGIRVGPFPPVSVPDLQKIYAEGSLPESSSKFLRYFLGKLSTVINASKQVEEPVDGFVKSCNKYLLSEEPSTVIGEGQQVLSGKALRLNRTNLRVHVEGVPERRKISLDALSSGEKQMISLFAKLFLYPMKKIVLIDEPELSLSIDWQTQILVDVLNAPLCEQVIAITHSPFVFDNGLEPFARSLTVATNFNALDAPIVEDEDQIDE